MPDSETKAISEMSVVAPVAYSAIRTANAPHPKSTAAFTLRRSVPGGGVVEDIT